MTVSCPATNRVLAMSAEAFTYALRRTMRWSSGAICMGLMSLFALSTSFRKRL